MLCLLSALCQVCGRLVWPGNCVHGTGRHKHHCPCNQVRGICPSSSASPAHCPSPPGAASQAEGAGKAVIGGTLLAVAATLFLQFLASPWVLATLLGIFRPLKATVAHEVGLGHEVHQLVYWWGQSVMRAAPSNYRVHELLAHVTRRLPVQPDQDRPKAQQVSALLRALLSRRFSHPATSGIATSMASSAGSAASQHASHAIPHSASMSVLRRFSWSMGRGSMRVSAEPGPGQPAAPIAKHCDTINSMGIKGLDPRLRRTCPNLCSTSFEAVVSEGGVQRPAQSPSVPSASSARRHSAPPSPSDPSHQCSAVLQDTDAGVLLYCSQPSSPRASATLRPSSSMPPLRPAPAPTTQRRDTNSQELNGLQALSGLHSAGSPPGMTACSTGHGQPAGPGCDHTTESNGEAAGAAWAASWLPTHRLAPLARDSYHTGRHLPLAPAGLGPSGHLLPWRLPGSTKDVSARSHSVPQEADVGPRVCATPMQLGHTTVMPAAPAHTCGAGGMGPYERPRVMGHPQGAAGAAEMFLHVLRALSAGDSMKTGAAAAVETNCGGTSLGLRPELVHVAYRLGLSTRSLQQLAKKNMAVAGHCCTAAGSSQGTASRRVGYVCTSAAAAAAGRAPTSGLHQVMCVVQQLCTEAGELVASVEVRCFRVSGLCWLAAGWCTSPTCAGSAVLIDG